MSFIIPGFNLRRKPSLIKELVEEYRKRLSEHEKYRYSVDQHQVQFKSFAEHRLSIQDFDWTIDNYRRFIEQTPNEIGDTPNFLSQLGYIMCMTYSPDGSHLIVGHSSGLIQVHITELLHYPNIHGLYGFVRITESLFIPYLNHNQ